MGHSDDGAGFKRKWEGMSKEEQREFLGRSFQGGGARRRANESLKRYWDNLSPEGYKARGEAVAEGVKGSRQEKSESMSRYWAGKTEEERRQHYLNSFGSEEANQKKSVASQKMWDGYTVEEKQARMEGWLNSKKAKENWKKTWVAKSAKEKEEWIKVHLRGRRRPTDPERRLGLYLNRNFPGEWKYNGDNVDGIVIGGKIPDFININGKKEVIEVFGTYWHGEDEVEEKIEHYKGFGFKCTVLWDYECYFIEDLERIFGGQA